MNMNGQDRSMIYAGLGFAAFVLVAAGLVLWGAADAYLWVKAFHVVAVIAWMAGLLYLPRLFVYHASEAPGSPQAETFKAMERRLLKAIMNPAMIASWAIGLWLIWAGPGLAAGWLHAKLLAVVVLSGFHMYLARAVRLFAADRNTRSARHWRIANEVPTLLLVGIVILAVVKPF